MGLPSLIEVVKFPEVHNGILDISALKDSFVGKDLLPGCGEHPSDFTCTT